MHRPTLTDMTAKVSPGAARDDGAPAPGPARSTAAAPLLVFTSVVTVQFGQAFGKQLSVSVGASGVVALRLGLAALLLLLVHRPALPRSWSQVRLVLAFGTSIAGMNLIYPAMRDLPLGLAVSLQLLGPVVLALVTSRQLRDLLFAGCAAGGVWLFHSPAGTSYPLGGMLLALAAGASMAAYLLLSRQAGAHTRDGGPLALALAWAAVLTVPIGVAENGRALLEPVTLAAGLAVAVLSAVLPYSLELAALRLVPPRIVAVLQSLEPAAGGAAGLLVLGERLHPAQWLALGCVGVACAGTVAGVRRRGSRREDVNGPSAPPR